MIITCGECNSSFVLDDSLIKTTGSKVRCSNCKHIFVVYPAKEEPEAVPEELVPPQTEAAVPKVEKPADQAAAPMDDDPDLSKALADIDDDELDFSDEELGIQVSSAPAEEKAVAAEPESVPVDEPVAEDVMAESELSTDVEEAEPAEDDILDFADFELDMEEDDIPGDVEEPESSVTEELGLSFDENDVMDELVSDSEASFDLDGDLEEELDFSDLERELSGDVEPAAEEQELSLDEDAVDTADTVVVDEGGLDFSDLNLDEDAGDQVDEDDLNLDLDEDLDLDLGLDEDSAVESETMMIEDELDFSDLERELDGQAGDDVPASEDELDLDLDLDDEVAEPETVLLEEDELDFSEFELDEPKEKAAEVSDEVKEETLESEVLDEELDFSSLSDILESDDLPDELPRGDEDLELELDLDSDDGMDTDAAEGEQDEEELDFSDLENILDGIDETKVEALPEDIDLELDQDEGAEEDIEFDLGLEDSESRGVPEEDDLDFSDVEAMLGSSDDEDGDLDLDLGDDDDAKAAPADDDEDLALSLDNEEDSDIELELDLTEEDSEEEEFDGEEADLLADDDVVDEAQEAGLVEKKKDKKAAKKTAKRKAKGKGGLVVKLILALIFILLILFVLYMSKNKIEDLTESTIPVNVPVLEDVRNSIAGMEIPFVSSWVKPEPKDPQGKLMLKTSGITGKIIVSETLGDLFVISGKVQNNYTSTRNSISLVGKLFGEGGKVVQSKLFYAGNNIPEDELVTMDEDVIKKRLQNRLGDNGINAKVRPGQIVPFMVVFTNLSENLTEFSVETGGSFQGAAIK